MANSVSKFDILKEILWELNCPLIEVHENYENIPCSKWMTFEPTEEIKIELNKLYKIKL